MRVKTVPIGSAGRVVIPKWVRDSANLQAGDELKISLEGQRIQLEPTGDDAVLIRKGHALVFRSKSSKPLTSKQVENLRSETLYSWNNLHLQRVATAEFRPRIMAP